MFSWVTPLMKQGNIRPLEDEDVWVLDGPDRVGATCHHKYNVSPQVQRVPTSAKCHQ
jgi:hypothetical protein